MPSMGMLSGIRRVWLLLGLALASPAFAEPKPFELRDGQVVILVTIRGQKVPALLDTGATRSLIEVDLARELGIRTQKVRSSNTVGASGGHITLGFTQREVAIDFGAGPMSRHIGTYEAGHTFAAEGVRLLIGMDFLDALVVSLDFQKMAVEFQRSSGFMAPSGEPLNLTRSGWHRPTLSIGLAGAPADLVLDTAASGSLHLDSSFVAATPNLNALPASRLRIAGIDGVREHKAILVPEVTLGGHVFENVRASSASLGLLRRFGDIDGVIGVDLLKRFNLVIDFGRHRLWMTPHANAAND